MRITQERMESEARYLFGAVWAVLLLIMPVVVAAQAAGQVTAQELYQGYAQWLNRVHTSLAFREIEEQTVSGYDWSYDRRIARRLICRDGERSATFMDAESFMKGEPLQNSVRARAIYTGEQKMVYSGRLHQTPRVMTVDSRPYVNEPRERLRSNGGYSLILDGYIFGDNRLWITDIAEQADSITIRPQSEILDGHETLVLEIDGDYGKHMIWIDPVCGYCARQLVVIKEPGDLWDTTKVGEELIPTRTFPRAVLQRHELRVESVMFEVIGDTYIPASGIVNDQLVFANGEKATVKAAFQREEITMRPDFETARAEFLQGIQDGVPVFFMDEVRKGIRYQWYQGEPRPTVSTAELAALDLIISEIDGPEESIDAPGRANTDVKLRVEGTLPAEVAVVPTGPQPRASRPSWQWWLFGTCTMLLMGAAALCVGNRRRRRRNA